VAVAGGAPPGLAIIALGADGADGGALVLAAAGIVAALIVAKAGSVRDPASWLPRPSLERALLAHAPESGATLLMAFERWVVEAITGSIGVFTTALGWAVAHLDEHTLATPTHAVAARVARQSRRLEPIVGGSLSRVAWAVVGAAAVAALLRGLWPVR
jgi:hypothetical protein